MFSFFCSPSYANDHEGFILGVLKNDARFKNFSNAVENSGLEQLFSKETKTPKTIYVPTDEAFNNLPDEVKEALSNMENSAAARKLVRTHYFIGSHQKLEEGEAVKSVNIDGKLIRVYQAKELFVKDMIVQKQEILVGNSKIIPIDCVMFLQPSSTDYRLSLETRNEYPITTCCLKTQAEVSQFMKGLDY
jgi:uncharacterized surface protein with fasciclin (FAS1) repeats